MVLILLAGVMFPLWPPSLRLGVYYLSLGVLGLIGVFMGIAVVRLILWVLTRLVMKRGIWWFPNLFEDVGFVSPLPPPPAPPPRSLDQANRKSVADTPRGSSQVDSFIPFWAWDNPASKKSKSKSSSSSSSSKSKSKSSSSSSSKSSKKAIPVAVPVAAGVGLGDAPSAAQGTGPTAGESSAMHMGGQANMRQRQQAYVEDAGDDE